MACQKTGRISAAWPATAALQQTYMTGPDIGHVSSVMHLPALSTVMRFIKSIFKQRLLLTTSAAAYPTSLCNLACFVLFIKQLFPLSFAINLPFKEVVSISYFWNFCCGCCSDFEQTWCTCFRKSVSLDKRPLKSDSFLHDLEWIYSAGVTHVCCLMILNTWYSWVGFEDLFMIYIDHIRYYMYALSLFNVSRNQGEKIFTVQDLYELIPIISLYLNGLHVQKSYFLSVLFFCG